MSPVVCGARYKTRPGLTYHFTHSHKNKENDEDDSSSASAGAGAPGGPAGGAGSAVNQGSSGGPGSGMQGDVPTMGPGQMLQSSNMPGNGDMQKGADGQGAAWSKFQDSYLTFLKSPGMLFSLLLITSNYFFHHSCNFWVCLVSCTFIGDYSCLVVKLVCFRYLWLMSLRTSWSTSSFYKHFMNVYAHI